jgi:hypothetical protein
VTLLIENYLLGLGQIHNALGRTFTALIYSWRYLSLSIYTSFRNFIVVRCCNFWHQRLNLVREM